MSNPRLREKAEEEKPTKRKLPPGWRNFQKVLKQVIKAPPMPRKESKHADAS